MGLCRLSPVGRFLKPASRLLQWFSGASVSHVHHLSPPPQLQLEPAHENIPQIKSGRVSSAWRKPANHPPQALHERSENVRFIRPVWRAQPAPKSAGWMGAAPIISRLLAAPVFQILDDLCQKASAEAPSRIR